MRYPDIRLYIDGEWRSTAHSLPVLNPADEMVIGQVPVATTTDLEHALEAAQRGFALWRRYSPRTRSDIILKAAALMRQRVNEIAHSITLEHGKPLDQARLEVIRGCEFFEWDAAEGQRCYGRVIPSEPDTSYSVVRQPIGPVAAFSPWNFPMSQPSRKIAGALAAGCSIIIKAAEETPAGAFHIARALHDAGVPAGVFNLLFGNPAEISSHLIPHDTVRLVAFTGSTAVGRHLTGIASEHMTPVLMELGGHAPVIICDDVDPHQAATVSAIRKARNAGQVCTSPTRFFAHETLFDDFARTFADVAAKVKVGNGLQAGTEMGPVANDRRLAMMDALVADALDHGAELLTGGERLGNRGYFFPVTVLANVPDEARIMQEEPFGPIAVINPVRSLDDAIAKANSVPFGLAAYAFTHRTDNVAQLVNEIEAGNLSINTLEASVAETPFGGVKSSGYGREGGAEGLDNYTIIKNVSHRTGGGQTNTARLNA